MDTSKSAIVVATLLPDEENPVTDRIANEEAAVRRLVGRFADRSVVRAWYEAGPGYELYRLLCYVDAVLVCDGIRLTGPSLLVTEPEFGLFGTLTGPLDDARVAGQDAVELAARGDAELGEDLAQVVCDGVCTDE